MSLTALEKGKGTAVDQDDEPVCDSSVGSTSASDSASSSEDDSESDSETDEEVTQGFLESLLETARRNAALKARGGSGTDTFAEEDVIRLDDSNEKPIPQLDPGSLPAPYIQLSDSRKAGPLAVKDIDIEQAERMASSSTAPAAPEPPKIPQKTQKKAQKALKNKTTGPDWFGLPAPPEAELPRLYREVEALRLRNQLDPKRFYKKEEGEGKGIKGLPKHFAIGTIIPESSPFGAASVENLSKASRKRTLVDELVDDAEAKAYAKKKFKELQSVRGARGRGTLAQKKALRRPKW